MRRLARPIGLAVLAGAVALLAPTPVTADFAPAGGWSAGTQTQSKQKAQDAARQRAKQEAARRAQQEARRKAQAEAARRAQQEAARRAQQEARRKAQADAARRAQQEAARRAQQEARRKAQADAARRAQQEAARRAQQEARRKAQADAARRAQQDAARRAQQESRRQAQAEAARRAQQESARRAQQEARRKAQSDAARRAQQDAARRAQQDARRQSDADAARRAAREAARRSSDPTRRTTPPPSTRGTQEDRRTGRPTPPRTSNAPTIRPSSPTTSDARRALILERRRAAQEAERARRQRILDEQARIARERATSRRSRPGTAEQAPIVSVRPPADRRTRGGSVLRPDRPDESGRTPSTRSGVLAGPDARLTPRPSSKDRITATPDRIGSGAIRPTKPGGSNAVIRRPDSVKPKPLAARPELGVVPNRPFAPTAPDTTFKPIRSEPTWSPPVPPAVPIAPPASSASVYVPAGDVHHHHHHDHHHHHHAYPGWSIGHHHWYHPSVFESCSLVSFGWDWGWSFRIGFGHTWSHGRSWWYGQGLHSRIGWYSNNLCFPYVACVPRTYHRWSSWCSPSFSVRSWGWRPRWRPAWRVWYDEVVVSPTVVVSGPTYVVEREVRRPLPTLESAWTAFEDGRYLVAVGRFESIIEARPEDADARLGRGLSFAAIGDVGTAAEDLRLAISGGVLLVDNPWTSSRARRRLSDIRIRSEGLVRDGLGDADSWLVLATARLMSGDAGGAYFAADKAIDAGDPSDAAFYVRDRAESLLIGG